MADEYPRPQWGAGDIIEWMSSPVLLLTEPVQKGTALTPNAWQCRATYLRAVEDRIGHEPGTTLEFTVNFVTTAWADKLTDAELAMAGRMLLLGG